MDAPAGPLPVMRLSLEPGKIRVFAATHRNPLAVVAETEIDFAGNGNVTGTALIVRPVADIMSQVSLSYHGDDLFPPDPFKMRAEAE
jgi:hypothetical protein